ncbi:MAG: putative aminohydrolase SsnA [Anaerolineaceae bacterium]|nr:putative aminohydrolase SsnA [Anaerolineaceae bacterium]
MLITNAKLITWETPNRILTDHALLIQEGIIREVGTEADLMNTHPAEERLDAEGQYVMPGNICAHTHFYSAFSRGLAIPGTAPDGFQQILARLWWPLDQSLDQETVRYSALVSLIDAIHHGTTTLVDHHASPNFIDGSLDVLGDAVDESGLRASLCYEVTDRYGEARSRAAISENYRFIHRIRSEQPANGRLSGLFGIHASLTVTDQTLEACREAAPEGAGFHIHVAEHISDEYDAIEKSGMRVVDRLNQHQILGPNSIAVHAVSIDSREISLLAETGTWVTHQPRSNMNNAVGLSDIESFLRAGIKVCMGNDGFSNAMWLEWKTAYLAHKLWNRDPRRMNGMDLVQIAVYNNAALASQLFPGAPLGVIVPGAAADLIFVDYHPFTPITPENLPWHILFGFDESLVTTTMVAGKLLMSHRQLLTLDEEEISHRAMELAPQVWRRYQNQLS